MTFRISVILFVLATAAGCTLQGRGYVSTPPPPSATVSVQANAPPPPTGHVTVAVNQPQFATGVQVIEASCQQGAAEQCNGLDDNCNGQIDEGCGYSSGAVQITLAWNSGADLDLYVTDPMGATLSYNNTHTQSGGYLDQDARGQCRPQQPNNTIENVYWNAQNPPRGGYAVDIHYWGDCNSGAGPTTATLSIAVGGQIWRSLQYTLAPNQRQTVASFQI